VLSDCVRIVKQDVRKIDITVLCFPVGYISPLISTAFVVQKLPGGIAFRFDQCKYRNMFCTFQKMIELVPQQLAYLRNLSSTITTNAESWLN
jgi:hypothetical protein